MQSGIFRYNSGICWAVYLKLSNMFEVPVTIAFTQVWSLFSEARVVLLIDSFRETNCKRRLIFICLHFLVLQPPCRMIVCWQKECCAQRSPGDWESKLSVKLTKRVMVQLVCVCVCEISRVHSFPRQNLTNSAANLVSSAAYRGKADKVPRLTANTQLNFRGLIKSWINRSNTCYELMNPSLFIH